MTITLVILAGFFTVLLGRWMFGKWYNHVGLYGIAWSFSLALFHVGYISYYPLEVETWFVIIAGWIAFVCGASSVAAAKFAMGARLSNPDISQSNLTPSEQSSVLRILWIINGISILGSIYDIYNVSRLLGGVVNILTLGNLLYSIRVHEGIPGAIPYLGTLTFVGSLLAGYYTSMIGRMSFVALLAILTSVINSITNMSRAALIVSGILFVTGFIVCRKTDHGGGKRKGNSNFKRIIGLVFALLLIISAMELIRGNRGMTEGFAGETKSLKRLGIGAGSFITPSIVMYITAHHGVLNQYLKHDDEKFPLGHYSLAPVSRILSKFGFDTYIEQHQRFYNTPAQANTGTYLRELHADYGIGGVVIAPFFLGLISSVYWFRVKRNQALFDVVILSHIYVVVGMSLFSFATGMGVWWSSLFLGLLIVQVFKPDRQKSEKLSLHLKLADR